MCRKCCRVEIWRQTKEPDPFDEQYSTMGNWELNREGVSFDDPLT